MIFCEFRWLVCRGMHGFLRKFSFHQICSLFVFGPRVSVFTRKMVQHCRALRPLARALYMNVDNERLPVKKNSYCTLIFYFIFLYFLCKSSYETWRFTVEQYHVKLENKRIEV